MLQLNFTNSFNQSPDLKTEFDALLVKQKEHKAGILSRNQGFLELPFDLATADSIQTFADELDGKYNTILLLGIGGSMLGPQTLLGALRQPTASPEVIFWDNIDPDLISETLESIDLRKTLILVQSKSGGTPETLAQYFFLNQQLGNLELDPKEHFVFVTDPEKGILRSIANESGIPAFTIPANVGGRYSVLSPVGLLVCALVGIDIYEILEGGKLAIESDSAAHSDAYELALIQYLHGNNGRNIVAFWTYASKLKLMADWYVQLLAESIGKKLDRDGQIVHTGLTPLPALGVTDQHSKLQLFQEGPDDKLYIFVEVGDFANIVSIGSQLTKEVEFLNGVSFNQLLQAELNGTRQSLTEAGRPLITIKLDRIDGRNLGQLIVFLELSVAYLGELYGINTFDQPGVELSKTLTRKYLS